MTKPARIPKITPKSAMEEHFKPMAESCLRPRQRLRQSVKITLASPNDIRSWSFGEVKKPETINYRTYRPRRTVCSASASSAPRSDYECACGKYKGTKYKGIICDRCGVKVTHSRVRRKRMGHINLAAPVVHIWFFKAMPSRLGNLLGMKTADLEKVIYFQDYVVTIRATDLEYKQVLTEDEYRAAVEKYGMAPPSTGQHGRRGGQELLQRLDLNADSPRSSATSWAKTNAASRRSRTSPSG